jgi:hypothetical protein
MPTNTLWRSILYAYAKAIFSLHCFVGVQYIWMYAVLLAWSYWISCVFLFNHTKNGLIEPILMMDLGELLKSFIETVIPAGASSAHWIVNFLVSFSGPASWIIQQSISSWLTRYIIPLFSSANVFGVSAWSMQCSYDDKGNSVPTILLMMQKRLYVEGGLKVCLCS